MADSLRAASAGASPIIAVLLCCKSCIPEELVYARAITEQYKNDIAQTLSVTVDNPIAFGWITHTPDPSMVTSLGLGFIRETHLGRVLSVTRGLRILRWDWFCSSKSRHSLDTALIDLDEVAIAL